MVFGLKMLAEFDGVIPKTAFAACGGAVVRGATFAKRDRIAELLGVETLASAAAFFAKLPFGVIGGFAKGLKIGYFLSGSTFHDVIVIFPAIFMINFGVRSAENDTALSFMIILDVGADSLVAELVGHIFVTIETNSIDVVAWCDTFVEFDDIIFSNSGFFAAPTGTVLKH